MLGRCRKYLLFRSANINVGFFLATYQNKIKFASVLFEQPARPQRWPLFKNLICTVVKKICRTAAKSEKS